MTYLLAIDQGTTSTRAIVFSKEGNNCGQHQIELEQHFPNDAWVEHDATEIWSATQAVCVKACEQAGISSSQIGGIGITNQRETLVIWDRATGQPIHKAIVWQDRRTADLCTQLKAYGAEAEVQSKTGLLLDPYFSATKIQWLLDQYDADRSKSSSGQWAVGTIDCYLVWCLTQGKTHITDATNASRTLLFNIHTQSWDADLLKLFNIPEAILPVVCDSAGRLGEAEIDGLGAIPITGIAGDQQAAMVGQACFEPGMIKSTYGTGCFLMMNTGTKAVPSTNRLLTTVGYRLKGETTYALEGSIFIAGAAIQWLRDGLKIIKHAADTQKIAEQGNALQSVYLVPAFAGLGAPYWDPDARGAILGLTRASTSDDIVIAALQSVAYQTRDLVTAMQKDMQEQSNGDVIKNIRVDGGMVANDWVLQCLADILRVPVDRPKVIETTALGAAYLAGLGAEVLPDLVSISSQWQLEKNVVPVMPESDSDQLYEGWLKAVDRVRSGC